MIHNNEIVSIEEILTKPQQYYQTFFTRKFILTNRSTNLKLCIHTLGAIIESCELNNHQIIANNEPQNTEIQWNSHVYGYDTLSLNHQDSSQKNILYQMTQNNELILEGKGFNPIFQHLFLFNPFFFNLNSVENKPSLEGHYLQIRASHEDISLVTERNTVFSQFINNVPLLIPEYLEGSDFVYSANPSQIQDACIIATLSWQGRSMDVLLEVEQWAPSHLRILIKNGSVAFLPHNMSKFKITYKFYW